jgi:predicted nucleotidyltransferase
MLHMEHKDYSIEIVLELLKGENHIRNIAKSVGTSHMNISRKVKNLAKENIVDFKENGKNKTYFLKKTSESKTFTIMGEYYKYLKTLAKNPALRIIFDKIQRNKKIKLAILFGSYAKGLEKQDSDIDIYIETVDGKIRREVESIDSRLSVKIGTFSSDNLLIKEIIKNHVILKGAEEYYDKTEFFG